MTVCWDRMDVSELTLKIDYTRTLVDILCDIVITYTQKVTIFLTSYEIFLSHLLQQIFSNLDAEGFSGDLQVFVPSPLLQLVSMFTISKPILYGYILWILCGSPVKYLLVVFGNKQLRTSEKKPHDT